MRLSLKTSDNNSSRFSLNTHKQPYVSALFLLDIYIFTLPGSNLVYISMSTIASRLYCSLLFLFLATPFVLCKIRFSDLLFPPTWLFCGGEGALCCEPRFPTI